MYNRICFVILLIVLSGAIVMPQTFAASAPVSPVETSALPSGDAAAMPPPPVSAAAAPPAVAPSPTMPPAAAGDNPLAWGGDKGGDKGSAPSAAAPMIPPPAVDNSAPVNKTENEKRPETVSADRPADLQALEKRVTALEAAVSELQKNGSAEKNAEKNMEKNDSKNDSPAPAKKTVRKKAKARSAAASAWVLKSAKPGMAWISKKGSSELQAVTVGDTLEGVGKVTAVERDGTGQWAVIGTKGRISR